MFKKNQNHRLVGGMQQQYGFHHNSTTSPLNTPLRSVGPVKSGWNNQQLFDGAMRNFGMNMSQRHQNTILPRVNPLQSAAVVYHAGMRNSYNYLRNPRGADGDVTINDAQGNLNTVEKGLR